MPKTITVLAGDIGGTNARLGLFAVERKKVNALAQKTYASGLHASLDSIIQDFVARQPVLCDYACFGVAGPIREGKCETTNLPWRVDAQRIALNCGFNKVFLINDLEANAWGIFALKEEDFYTLNEGEAAADGNAAVIAAGTGLGEAGLYWDGRDYRPFASEGGHSDFAPRDEREIELLRFLMRRYQHVSWERVVSGLGLVNIYEFLCAYRTVTPSSWLIKAMQKSDRAAAISAAALSGRCPICQEALDMFVSLYGVEAGNQALKIMATGGVFIGGGIAPKILDKLKQPLFLEAFISKGRMEPLLRKMPVRVILNENAALYGSALYISSKCHSTLA